MAQAGVSQTIRVGRDNSHDSDDDVDEESSDGSNVRSTCVALVI